MLIEKLKACCLEQHHQRLCIFITQYHEAKMLDCSDPVKRSLCKITVDYCQEGLRLHIDRRNQRASSSSKSRLEKGTEVVNIIRTGQWYCDECIYRCLKSQKDSYVFDLLDSQSKTTHQFKRRKDLTETNVILAPVHRPAHWVLYALCRPDSRSSFRWFFGDSLKGKHSDTEIRRIIDILNMSTVNHPEAYAAPTAVQELPFPRQTDGVSCGVFVTEGALQFLSLQGEPTLLVWDAPSRLRERHAALIEGSP